MGKNVLIIGASGDIGLAIAKRVADEGYNLLLHYHKNRKAIDELKELLEAECVLMVIQADLAKDVEIKRLLTELVFPVDAIIFAGGTAHYGLLQDTSEKIMNEMLTLHVKAPWMISKHLLPHMIQKQFGKIIVITSIWGQTGAGNEVIYSSVKGAQNSFVKALAKEVAASGVSVNAVSPGYIETKMNRHLSNEEKASLFNEIPIRRAGLPSEVAHTILFLLDHYSTYIQGEIINITGGW